MFALYYISNRRTSNTKIKYEYNNFIIATSGNSKPRTLQANPAYPLDTLGTSRRKLPLKPSSKIPSTIINKH